MFIICIYLVVFAVYCDVSRTVRQLFACDLASCVSSEYKITLIV